MSSPLSPDQERRMWYSQIPVQFEIVKALRFRELQIIGDGISIRWLNVQHVEILRKDLAGLNLLERAANWYCSLDSYRRIPLMSWNLHERKKQYDEWNAGPRRASVIGQDFGLDLDMKAGSWRDAVEDAARIVDLFESFGVRFMFWMSGLHGFHFRIPFEDMPDDVKRLSYEEQIAFYHRMAIEINKGARSVDLSIYMPTRVLKCPYSLTKGGLVILPLDARAWADLREHGEEILRPLHVLKNYRIRDRGLYYGAGTAAGIGKFIREWDGWESAA